jgi:alanine-glyoxylate transaminase/(R)-3-amino-2-methylpropionate-pyruvate transaminase
MFDKYRRVKYLIPIIFNRINVVISFKRSYLTGSRVAMNPDPYRGIWGGQYCRDSPIQTTRSCNCSKDYCQASDRYVEQLEDILNYEVSKKKVAGMFIESIQVVFFFSSSIFQFNKS